MIPLPLPTQFQTVKFVRRLEKIKRMLRNNPGLAKNTYRFTPTPEHRPIIHPLDRLQMTYSTQSSHTLKVHKPMLTEGRFYHSALVGTVDPGLPLFENHSALIRAINMAGTKSRLPSFFNSAFGDNKVIKAVPFINLGSFGDLSDINDYAFIYKVFSVRTHPVKNNWSGPYRTMPQIGVAVIIPKRAGVLPAAYPPDFM